MKLTKQKQMGLAMILLGALLLATIGVFFKFNVLRVQGLPELLPEKETLFFTSSADRDFAKLILDEYFDDTVDQFLGNFWGFALLKPEIQDGEPIPVTIFQLKDPFLAQKSLEKVAKSVKSDFKIVDQFLIDGKKNAQERIEASVKHKDVFATNPIFLKASQFLPSASFGSFAFDNSESTFGHPFLKPFQFISGKWQWDGKTSPFLSVAALLKGGNGPMPQRRYHADVLKYFSSETNLFLGGEDLATRIRFFDPGLSNFNRILRGYGVSEINLEKQLFPLLRSEYGFSFLKDKKFLFISKMDGSEENKEALEFVKNQIPSVLSIVMPEIREVTLPDGTKGKELYASTDLVEISDETILGVPTKVYKTKHKPFELLVASKNDLLVISNDRKEIMLALSENVPNNFRQSSLYPKKIREVLRGVNELLIFNKDWFQKNFRSDVNDATNDFGKAFSFITWPWDAAYGDTLTVASIRYGEEALEMFVAL